MYMSDFKYLNIMQWSCYSAIFGIGRQFFSRIEMLQFAKEKAEKRKLSINAHLCVAMKGKFSGFHKNKYNQLNLGCDENGGRIYENLLIGMFCEIF